MGDKIALLPGRFDPPTNGHLDLIFRAASLVDKLYIAIGENKNAPLLNLEKRKELLKEITKKEKKITIIPLEELTINCAKKIKADFLIRGLRASGDFDEEFRMATFNQKLGKIETLFLPSNISYISGKLIREIVTLGGSIEEFVPPNVCKALQSTLGD